MPAPRPILRLCLGWLLMMAGVLLMLDCGLSLSVSGPVRQAVQGLSGFALVAGGWFLRRLTVSRPQNWE